MFSIALWKHSRAHNNVMAWTTALCVAGVCGRQLLFVRAQLENTCQSAQTHQMRVFFCLLHLLHLWFSDNFCVLVRSHEPSAWWLLGEKFACRRESCRGVKADKQVRHKPMCWTAKSQLLHVWNQESPKVGRRPTVTSQKLAASFTERDEQQTPWLVSDIKHLYRGNQANVKTHISQSILNNFFLK